ncbi:rhodanese-like domain-containing protein 7 [Telopea speciosissima]|uniref:rhodanese-like domain-containing protein 7 n=1 Tax=Telopea speciosissima TaxID=54955 RepID=UPI001CC46B09|nr:rhodanese-like domain-containing protein 7 [Telopea speciosissima]
MQSSPLLRCRTVSVVARRMLSSCLSSKVGSSPSFSFSRTMSANSSETQETAHHPFFSNLKISHPNPAETLHRNANVSRCFSRSLNRSSSIPISSTSELRNQQQHEMEDSIQKSLVVVSFYKFADFADHADMRKPLKELCEEVRVSGGIILAPEGINGSICGTRESVERVLGFIQADNRLKGLRQVESPVSPEDEAIHHGHTSSSPLGAGEDAPFRWDHVRVKVKKEIVSLGMPTVSPIERVGKYVNPRDWNTLIRDPDTVVIDVRNTYETRIGKFKGAIDPCTTAFRTFPSWVDDQFELAGPEEVDGSNDSSKERTEIQGQRMPTRVAMYCTGGIRCEKASSFLLSKGFKEVYHLEGGILKYMEEVPKSESLWEGECFVFDKRVSVEHGLIQGTFQLCYGCKQPVNDADMEAPEWEYGVSCPYCFSTKSEEEKERARARQRQFENWGIIGGPDKGRRPLTTTDGNSRKSSVFSNSI